MAKTPDYLSRWRLIGLIAGVLTALSADGPNVSLGLFYVLSGLALVILGACEASGRYVQRRHEQF